MAKLTAIPNRYDEAAIEAIDRFDIKLAQAKAIVGVLTCAHTDPSGHPTQEMTALVLQVAGDLLDEAQRVIEPVISRVSLAASVRPSSDASAPSDSSPPPDAA